MCCLCSQDGHVRDAARAHTNDLAHQLEALAAQLRAMAQGTLPPHSAVAATMAAKARTVMRELSAQFL